MTTTLLAGLFAAGQTFAADQQQDVQAGSVVQTEAQQQTRVVDQQQVPAPQLTPEQVRTLQRSLQENGLDPGPVDGLLGPRTGQALRHFQQGKDLAATGRVDRQTLDALHLDEFMVEAPESGAGQEKEMEQQPLGIGRQGALQDDEV
jgi:peptidoglycan hydrolase-like protein with peptidoglycan-binding domain